MKNTLKKILSLALLVTFAWPLSSSATTLVASISADSMIYSASPTTNYGTDVNYQLGDASSGSSEAWRPIFKFDLSSIPSNATVSSANLEIYEDLANYSNGPVSSTVSIYRILTGRDWVQNQVTWNVYSTGNNWGTAGANNTTTDRSSSSSANLTMDGTAANAYVSWTGSQLTTDVQNIVNGTNPNYGWVMVSSNELAGTTQVAQNRFKSFDAAADRPKLTVEYTIPTASSSIESDLILFGDW